MNDTPPTGSNGGKAARATKYVALYRQTGSESRDLVVGPTIEAHGPEAAYRAAANHPKIAPLAEDKGIELAVVPERSFNLKPVKLVPRPAALQIG